MKSQKYSLILDLDGTLYKYDRGRSVTFQDSKFHDDVKNRILNFISIKGKLDNKKALDLYTKLKKEYNGDVAKAISSHFNISESKYYQEIWLFDPKLYIRKNKLLAKNLNSIKGNFIIVTGSPKIWAYSVLKHLEVDKIVGDNILTCEDLDKKPDIKVFKKAISILQKEPEFVFSIGDDEATDIIAPKSIDIKTIFIGEKKSVHADYNVRSFNQAIEFLKNKHFI